MRLHDLPPATVADALTRRTVPELRALAALIGHSKLQRKPELVGSLERFLQEPADLRALATLIANDRRLRELSW